MQHNLLRPWFCLNNKPRADHGCHTYVLDARLQNFKDIPRKCSASVSCKAKNKAWFGVIDCMSKLDKDWTILEETIAMANGTHEFADEAGGTVRGSDVVWRKLKTRT